MRGPIIVSISIGLALGSACRPIVDDGEDTGGGTVDASSGAPATISESTAHVTADTSTASDTAAPADCGSLSLGECNAHEGCRSASGPEASPQGEPGNYYCSDLIMPFACVSLDCEPVPGTPILCKIDDPDTAVWVIDECIPAGWEECPDSMCA